MDYTADALNLLLFLCFTKIYLFRLKHLTLFPQIVNVLFTFVALLLLITCTKKCLNKENN